MNSRLRTGLLFVLLGLVVLYVGLVNVGAAFTRDTRGCNERETFGPQIADNGGIVYHKGACTEYRYEWQTYTGSFFLGAGFVGFGGYRVLAELKGSER